MCILDDEKNDENFSMIVLMQVIRKMKIYMQRIMLVKHHLMYIVVLQLQIPIIFTILIISNLALSASDVFDSKINLIVSSINNIPKKNDMRK